MKFSKTKHMKELRKPWSQLIKCDWKSRLHKIVEWAWRWDYDPVIEPWAWSVPVNGSRDIKRCFGSTAYCAALLNNLDPEFYTEAFWIGKFGRRHGSRPPETLLRPVWNCVRRPCLQATVCPCFRWYVLLVHPTLMTKVEAGRKAQGFQRSYSEMIFSPSQQIQLFIVLNVYTWHSKGFAWLSLASKWNHLIVFGVLHLA